MHVPDLTTRQMIEVDRLMVEEYGIQLIQMMENAGRNLAVLARQMVGGDVRTKRIAVLCGAGNNGGGGLVAARHLHNWDAEVMVSLVAPQDQFKGVPAHQLTILKKMGIPDTQRNRPRMKQT
jgi:NAD(P)H-hydrate epimerase